LHDLIRLREIGLSQFQRLESESAQRQHHALGVCCRSVHQHIKIARVSHDAVEREGDAPDHHILNPGCVQ
jgi:hypothetical protein